MSIFRSRFFAVLIALAVGAVPASAALITFEGLPDGTVITNQFPEVFFFANAGFETVVTTQPGIGFGDNFICTAPSGEDINCTQETFLDFTTPVNNLRFWQIGDNAVSATAALVDVYENFVLTATVAIPGFDTFSTPDLVDLSSFTDVTRIQMHSITDPGGLGWDNFEFDVSSSEVGEPTTFALLALGLGAALRTRRRRA